MSIFIMFAPKKERQEEKEEKWKRGRDGTGAGWEYTRWKVRDVRGTQEFTAARAHVKDRAKKEKSKKKKNPPAAAPNQCSRPTELIPRERLFLSLARHTPDSALVRAIFAPRRIEFARSAFRGIKERLINQVCPGFASR